MRKSLQRLAVSAMILVFFALETSASQKARVRIQSGSITGPTNMYSTAWMFSSCVATKSGSDSRAFGQTRKRAKTRTSGGFDETVALIDRTAVVKLKFGDDPCVINFAFRSNKVIVSQEGSLLGCGFGFNVEPDGTYLKTSSKAPDLPPL